MRLITLHQVSVSPHRIRIVYRRDKVFDPINIKIVTLEAEAKPYPCAATCVGSCFRWDSAASIA